MTSIADPFVFHSFSSTILFNLWTSTIYMYAWKNDLLILEITYLSFHKTKHQNTLFRFPVVSLKPILVDGLYIVNACHTYGYLLRLLVVVVVDWLHHIGLVPQIKSLGGSRVGPTCTERSPNGQRYFFAHRCYQGPQWRRSDFRRSWRTWCHRYPSSYVIESGW